MSPRSGRRKSVCWMAAISAVFGVLGCQDASFATSAAPPSLPRSGSEMGTLSGSVNADGSVSFDPVESSATRLARGMSASIYGDQNVTVRLYSSNFRIDSISRPGTKSWSFDVGLRNYLAHPIGSNQNGPAPSDTLGVYVVIVSDPTVTSTSGSCSGSGCRVSVDSTTDGVGNFNGPGQKYYYWRERLAAKQSVAGADTTSKRKHWVFTGPSTITGFRFVLMVSAAWPPPYDASWSVFYNAATDSLPDTQAEPRWKRFVLPGIFLSSHPGSESWSPSGFVINSANGQNLYMSRADSLGAAEPAYIEARLKVNGTGSGSTTGVAFGLLDSVKLVAVGVADGKVGFVTLEWDTLIWPYNYRWEFFGPTYALANNGGRNFHTYRLRRFGTDSVRLEVDGARVLAIPGSQLQPRPDEATALTAFFGASGYNSSPTTTWSHVTYGFGATQP